MQHVALATKQLLIEYGPLEEGEALQPKTLDEQKELHQLFNDWIDATTATDAVPDQPPRLVTVCLRKDTTGK